MSLEAMLRTHPSAAAQNEPIARCIEECIECARACTVCADACLANEEVGKLRRCVALNLDCSDVCDTTAKVLSRASAQQLELTHSVLLACIQACRSCAAECERHADQHEHCRICAEWCRRCETACADAVSALTSLAS